VHSVSLPSYPHFFSLKSSQTKLSQKKKTAHSKCQPDILKCQRQSICIVFFKKRRILTSADI
jgi:hypothetical protein